MYRSLSESTGNLLGYELQGRLTEAEVEELHVAMAAALAEHGAVRMLVRVDHMEGIEPAAVWEDLKMTPQYLTKVERFAVVGDERWQRWFATSTDVLSKAQARFFSPEEMDTAWEWIRTQDTSAAEE